MRDKLKSISHAEAIKLVTEQSATIEARPREVDIDSLHIEMQWTPLFQELNRTNAALQADIERLKLENDALKETLEFYADPETYHAVAFFFDSSTGGFDDDFDRDHGNSFYDRPMPGRRARAVLGVK